MCGERGVGTAALGCPAGQSRHLHAEDV